MRRVGFAKVEVDGSGAGSRLVGVGTGRALDGGEAFFFRGTRRGNWSSWSGLKEVRGLGFGDDEIAEGIVTVYVYF